jgi:hypothetical protein
MMPGVLAASNSGNHTAVYDQSVAQNGGTTVLPGVSSTAGRTLSTTLLQSGQSTFIMLVVGDSISANSGPSIYTATHTLTENFNIYDGLCYRYQDPVLGASTGSGSYPAMIIDKLLDSGRFARGIVFDPAIGGTTSRDWSASGPFNQRAQAALWWMKSLRWPINGSADAWRFAIVYVLGTNDNAVGTSQSVFTANGNSFIQSVRGIGCTADIFVATSTLLNNAISTAIQSAQADMISTSAGIFALGNMDSLTGVNRQSDSTHLSTTGEGNWASICNTTFLNHY